MADSTMSSRNAIFDVKGCARCGGDHKDLTFLPFHNPVIVGVHNGMPISFQYWAWCPDTLEPLLLHVEKEHDVHS